MDENVNDPGFRKELLNRGGFCREHARAMAEMRNVLGLSILYKDQLKHYQEYLIQSMKNTDYSGEDFVFMAIHDRCPACMIYQESINSYLSAFLKGLVEKELKIAYEKAPNICLPHFMNLIKKQQSIEQKKYLIQVETAKLQALICDLEEFQRKHDYRYASEPYGHEKDSWARAINTMVGGWYER